MEDSGGMWLEEMEDSCYPFDKEFVESQLDAMSFPEHEQKKEIASTYNLIDDLGSIEKLKKILYLIFDYPHKHYTFKYFEV